MNKRLSRILDEIQKTEEKIAEWQVHLRELNERKNQLEDAEIIKSIRSMKLESRELLQILAGVKEGTVSFQYQDNNSGRDAEMPVTAQQGQVPEDKAPEREDIGSENKD